MRRLASAQFWSGGRLGDLPYMHHQQSSRTAALVLSGTGYNPGKEFTARRIASYRDQGIAYRWGYTFEDLSPAFRAPLAHFFA